MQARKNAEAVELAVRLDRLQQQAGSSMVTTNTLASMDEDDDSALKRFNIILKVWATSCLERPDVSCYRVVELHLLLAVAECITMSIPGLRVLCLAVRAALKAASWHSRGVPNCSPWPYNETPPRVFCILLTTIAVQADATGALEAVKAAIGSLPQDRVQPRFLLAAASDITKSDVDLAFASDGIIVGFNIDPSEAVLAAAKQYGEHVLRLVHHVAAPLLQIFEAPNPWWQDCMYCIADGQQHQPELTHYSGPRPLERHQCIQCPPGMNILTQLLDTNHSFV